MDKLITSNNGGFPFVLDDLRWMDQGYREAFFGFLSAFGVAANETFILSGCNRSVSGAVVSISEGYVAMEGEIHHLAAQTYPIPSPGQTEYFAESLTYDPLGTKVYQNGDSNDAYEIRKAKIEVSATPPSIHTTITGAKRFFELVQDNIPQIDANTAAIATKSTNGHTHSALHYFSSQKAHAVSNGLEVDGQLFVDQGITTHGAVVGIHGNATTTKRGLITRYDSDDNVAIRVDHDGTPNWGGLFQFKENGDMTFSSSSNRVRDRGTGTVIGSTSDERLKKNIKPLGSILSKIKKLKAITHLWKDDEDTAEAKYGFIAQEVEKVFPELIDTSDQGYKSLDYPKMTVILTKAMQEQQKQIDALKKKVDELSA